MKTDILPDAIGLLLVLIKLSKTSFTIQIFYPRKKVKDKKNKDHRLQIIGINNKGKIDNQTDSYEYRLHSNSFNVSSNSFDNQINGCL